MFRLTRSDRALTVASVRDRRRRRSRGRPAVEVLEGRCLLATSFTQTNLVSDVPGLAKTTDPNLVNPWGLALGVNSPFWVSDNGTGKATIYDGTGKAIPLVVNIPAPGASATHATPTGQVSNPTQGFVVSANSKS